MSVEFNHSTAGSPMQRAEATNGYLLRHDFRLAERKY